MDFLRDIFKPGWIRVTTGLISVILLFVALKEPSDRFTKGEVFESRKRAAVLSRRLSEFIESEAKIDEWLGIIAEARKIQALSSSLSRELTAAAQMFPKEDLTKIPLDRLPPTSATMILAGLNEIGAWLANAQKVYTSNDRKGLSGVIQAELSLSMFDAKFTNQEWQEILGEPSPKSDIARVKYCVELIPWNSSSLRYGAEQLRSLFETAEEDYRDVSELAEQTIAIKGLGETDQEFFRKISDQAGLYAKHIHYLARELSEGSTTGIIPLESIDDKILNATLQGKGGQGFDDVLERVIGDIRIENIAFKLESAAWLFPLVSVLLTSFVVIDSLDIEKSEWKTLRPKNMAFKGVLLMTGAFLVGLLSCVLTWETARAGYRTLKPQFNESGYRAEAKLIERISRKHRQFGGGYMYSSSNYRRAPFGYGSADPLEERQSSPVLPWRYLIYVLYLSPLAILWTRVIVLRRHQAMIAERLRRAPFNPDF